MNLAELHLDPAEVTEKLAEYEQALAEGRTREDEALAQAYRAAKRGLPLIRLSHVIAAGGYFDGDAYGLPKIAVVRADAQMCFVRWDYDALIYASRNDYSANRGALVGVSSVRVHPPELPEHRPTSWRRSGRTIVPLIPPRHRAPGGRGRLRLASCHVLWEVDSWDMVPPKDPALIRWIRGDLWTVLATWDLTELERYVLSQRLA